MFNDCNQITLLCFAFSLAIASKFFYIIAFCEEPRNIFNKNELEIDLDLRQAKKSCSIFGFLT